MHAPVLAPAIAETGLTFVVFGTVAFSLVMSLLFLVTRGKDNLYDHIGQGGLTRESDYDSAGPVGDPASPAARAEREHEIRQMLRARSDRMQRRGEAPLDVDAELARLLAAEGQGNGAGGAGGAERDRGLVEEVRQLVVARNERRERQGLEALDVEAEVARTLAELDP